MNTAQHDNGQSEANTERLADILTRMEKRFVQGEQEEQSPPLPDTEQNLPVAISPAGLPILSEYIRSEQFLEISGFFTPSSKRIEHIGLRTRFLQN